MAEIDISLLTETLLRETRGQITVEWEIKNFLEMPNQEDCYLNSKFFLLSDAEWYMKICPNGESSTGSVGWISLFLYKKNSPSDVDVTFTIGIKKTNGSIFKSRVITDSYKKEGEGWGIYKFLLRSELLESHDVFTPNGTLVVFCTARLENGAAAVEAASQTSSTEGVETLQENFKSLFLNGRDSDVTIKVQNQEFRAHRLILASRSPAFSAMFTHDTLEKQSGIVEITDCNPESFKDFLFFLYTGDANAVSSNNVITLYQTAEKYDVMDLKRKCVQFMADEMSAETCCEIILLATTYYESSLLERATNFFIKNSKAIFSTYQWESFVGDNFKLANGLLMKLSNRNDWGK